MLLRMSGSGSSSLFGLVTPEAELSPCQSCMTRMNPMGCREELAECVLAFRGAGKQTFRAKADPAALEYLLQRFRGGLGCSLGRDNLPCVRGNHASRE